MSLENYVHALPKAELNVQLEGALQFETLAMIAEQNDIASTFKTKRQYQQWMDYFKNPDYSRLDEINRTLAGWLRVPEDLTRVVYDLGVSLHKQNVKYAEVTVQPAIYTDVGMTFDTFLSALNDGRDRVLRGWGVTINWILAIPRSRPRKGDDIARWSTGATGRKGNVIGMGVVGDEKVYPADQFVKPFTSVRKKDLPTVTHAATYAESAAISSVCEMLNPNRLYDAWNIVDDFEAIDYLVAHKIPLVITPTREVRLGRISQAEAYPLLPLIESGIPLVLGAGMPTYYKTTLNDEYTAAVRAGLDVEQIERLALNAVRYSFMPEDDKQEMLMDFSNQFEMLRSEHLAVE